MRKLLIVLLIVLSSKCTHIHGKIFLFLSFVPVWGNVKFIYLLNSFNKETLLLLLLLFDSRISGVMMTCKDSRCNQLHWTEVESFEIIWHQIRAKLGIFVNPVGYSEGFEEKREIRTEGKLTILEFQGHEGKRILEILKTTGVEIKYGSRPWYGIDISWNSPFPVSHFFP